jgi:glucose-1-phosphate cytidylyltransferase
MVVKAVILAGGLGTRLSEETYLKPKPMVEIGGMPILWHIMKIYSAHGINEFIICCGYKGYVIKEYFANYFLHMSDVTFNMVSNEMFVHQKHVEPWKVTLVDTGQDTHTGGRLKRITEHIESESAFCFTYGDGLADIDISSLVKFHEGHGRWATITAVKPPGRYGSLYCEDTVVKGFVEKPMGHDGLINGGFFVLSPEVLKLIAGDLTSFEGGPLSTLASLDQMRAYRHDGFWQPMDTLRDRNALHELWINESAPWKVW